MVRAERANNRTAGIDTSHSTMVTLLQELSLICERRCSNCKVVAAEFCIWWQNTHYHLANLWNRITTKILDVFRIITSKQQIFSQSDPVLIHQFSQKLLSDPVLIRPKLASVLIQSDPVLIRAHLWITVWNIVKLCRPSLQKFETQTVF